MNLGDASNPDQDPSSESSGSDPARKPPESSPAPVYTQPFAHTPISARVPERVGRGVFSTGVIVQEGPGEFVLDFLQSLTRPPQICARMVLSPQVMQALVVSLGENLAKYSQTFGAPPPMPKPPPNQPRPTTQELYENFKLSDELLSGDYANSVLIGHDPAEFFMDFITRFYPTAAVSCRIYLAASQVPRVLETLGAAMAQYQKRLQNPPQGPPPGSDPAAPQP